MPEPIRPNIGDTVTFTKPDGTKVSASVVGVRGHKGVYVHLDLEVEGVVIQAVPHAAIESGIETSTWDFE